MTKSINHALSRQTQEALRLLGRLIKTARLERKITGSDLAQRAGISRVLLQRIERGEPSCSIGAVFETAVIVGVPLFEAERSALTMRLRQVEDRLALLPKTARPTAGQVNDDF
jgi:transcriptional regulator with XRE-family HTH domain